MPEQDLGARPSNHHDESILIEPGNLESARQVLAQENPAGPLAQFERDQLARDIADIESATAALRRADPALQSWTKPQAPAIAKVRPLWRLIALLWLSTALVTVGAAYAIVTLVG
jgi:hypothetical protein